MHYKSVANFSWIRYCDFWTSFCTGFLPEFPEVHFGEVFTGLNVTAKSILRKFEVFTRANLAAYQIAYFIRNFCRKFGRKSKNSCAIYSNRCLSFSEQAQEQTHLSKGDDQGKLLGGINGATGSDSCTTKPQCWKHFWVSIIKNCF